MIHLDRSNGKYASIAIIPLGKSVNGYLVVKVGQRIDATHVTDITEFPDLPALPLSAAKNKLQELATGQSSPASNSFQIDWHVDDVEVQRLSGASYVRAATSKEAKQVLTRHLQEQLPHATSISVGRAMQKVAPREDMYIN